MSGLTELSDTASDLTPDVRGDSEPLPTTITTQSYMVMSDWASSHKETLCHWLQGEPDELQRAAGFNTNVSAFDNVWTKHELWPGAVQRAVRPCFAWPEIDPQSAHEAIIAVLRWWGRGAVADRLVYLRGLAREDPEESPIDLDSLRAMAHLLMNERQLPDPRTSVTSDGFVHIEWRFPSNGILAMVFLPSGLIRFAAVSVPASKGIEQLTVNGSLPRDKALAAVRQFTSYL